MLIGITGTNAAGKGTAAQFFVQRRFSYFSLSDELRAVMKEQGMAVSRDSLIAAGRDVREKHGSSFLAERVLKKIKGNAVVDSIRNPGEVEALRKHGRFVLLAIDAPVRMRFERARTRNREHAEQSLEAFRKKEEKEMRGSGADQQLAAVMAAADHTVINDTTVENLYKKLETLLSRLR